MEKGLCLSWAQGPVFTFPPLVEKPQLPDVTILHRNSVEPLAI